MVLLSNFNGQQFIYAFSWMLIHSLWQGLLLAIVCGSILTIWKRSVSAVKYNLILSHFLLFLIGCITTFVLEWNTQSAGNISHDVTVKVASSPLLSIHIETVSKFVQSSISYFSGNAAMILLVWFVFFLFRSMQMMGSLLFVRRAKRNAIYSPPAYWQTKVGQLCQKLQLTKTVKLLESGYIKVPMILGHLKPVILIPAGLLSGLPAEQVEAVLLHELAHIKRNDYLVNLLQTITEAIFFFNPGLFWISALLREERENCCDDVALEQTNNKSDLILALISFKEHALYGNSCAVAFPGKKNMLFKRISRIINNKSNGFAPVDKALFLSGTLILLTIITLLAINHPAITSGEIVLKTTKTYQPAQKKAIAIKNDGEIKFKAVNEPKIHSKQNITTKKAPVLQQITKPANEKDILYVKSIIDKIQNRNDVFNEELQLKQQQQEQVAKDMAHAKLDREQAIRDTEQAKHDMRQARLDQIQMKKDMEQARIDQIQTTKDMLQAKRDYMEAMKNNK